LIQALGESHRVLLAGGVLVINTCTHQQIRDGSWYAALIPDAVERLSRRYVPVDTLCALLAKLGFDVRGVNVPVDAVFYGERYLDPSGPFKKSWRSGDSIWSLATDAELDAALAKLRALHEAGEAVAFMRDRDRLRKTIGQAVFVQAQRR
jgi:hypothetical protein